jgi:hypothetical protein
MIKIKFKLTNKQLEQLQSLHLQYFLCPFKHETTP